jgi:hypothetical protein
MSTIKIGTFTYELTNSVLVTDAEMGIRAISIFCSTATTGTVVGGAVLGSLSSTALTIAQDESITFVADEAGSLGQLTITAPSGCTLQIIAQV